MRTPEKPYNPLQEEISRLTRKRAWAFVQACFWVFVAAVNAVNFTFTDNMVTLVRSGVFAALTIFFARDAIATVKAITAPLRALHKARAAFPDTMPESHTS